MPGDLQRYAAANARLRALRGMLLGPAALEALYTYPNPASIQDALRRTPYDGDIAGRIVSAGTKLAAMLDGTPRQLIRLYCQRYEVDALKLAIRSVGRGPTHLPPRPPALALGSLASIELDALFSASGLNELVRRLAGSPYYGVLHSALPNAAEWGTFPLEVAVELDFYERLWNLTYELRPSDGKRVRDLLGVLYDILNLQWIAHHRDATRLSAEEVLNYTLREGRWIDPERRRRLADRPDEWTSPLAGTPFEAFALRAEHDGPDAALPSLWQVLADEIRRALRGYPFHAAGPLALLMAQELEIQDIQRLLAMKRLGLSAAEALPHLVSGSAGP